MTDRSSKIARIIIDARLRRLSETDRQTLAEWLREDRQNRLLYKRIIRGEAARDYYRALKEGNETLDINKIAQQIRISLAGHRRTVRRSRSFRITAAVSAVAVSVVLLFFLFNTEPMSTSSGDTEQTGFRTPVIVSAAGTVDLPVLGSENIVNALDYALTNAVDTAGPVSDTETVQFIVPRTYTYSIILEEGTKVILNSDSRLVYPARFGEGIREVFVEGEAYFEVTHDPGRPFVVNTPAKIHVEVLGTTFNITSYADDPVATATLVEGKVKVSVPGSSVTLSPHQQAVFFHGSERLAVVDVDAYSFTAWKDGFFDFQQRTLSDILRELSRWYDIEVAYDDPAVMNLRFQARFSRDFELKQVLELLSKTRRVSFVLEGRRLKVS